MSKHAIERASEPERERRYLIFTVLFLHLHHIIDTDTHKHGAKGGRESGVWASCVWQAGKDAVLWLGWGCRSVHTYHIPFGIFICGGRQQQVGWFVWPAGRLVFFYFLTFSSVSCTFREARKIDV